MHPLAGPLVRQGDAEPERRDMVVDAEVPVLLLPLPLSDVQGRRRLVRCRVGRLAVLVQPPVPEEHPGVGLVLPARGAPEHLDEHSSADLSAGGAIAGRRRRARRPARAYRGGAGWFRGVVGGPPFSSNPPVPRGTPALGSSSPAGARPNILTSTPARI